MRYNMKGYQKYVEGLKKTLEFEKKIKKGKITFEPKQSYGEICCFHYDHGEFMKFLEEEVLKKHNDLRWLVKKAEISDNFIR